MYIVTIKEVRTETSKTREYQRIADSGNEKDGGAVYGYVEAQRTQEIETKIYEQTAQSLDLVSVIKAVNELP